MNYFQIQISRCGYYLFSRLAGFMSRVLHLVFDWRIQSALGGFFFREICIIIFATVKLNEISKRGILDFCLDLKIWILNLVVKTRDCKFWWNTNLEQLWRKEKSSFGMKVPNSGKLFSWTSARNSTQNFCNSCMLEVKRVRRIFKLCSRHQRLGVIVKVVLWLSQHQILRLTEVKPS